MLRRPSSGSKLPLLRCTHEDTLLKDPTLVSCRARLASLARTSPTMEEKKNICQSSKYFNYPTPTQGSFGNCPSALQSASQGPRLAKHLSTCIIAHAWVVVWNDVSSRDLLAFSLSTEMVGNNPGIGSKHAGCCRKMVAGGSVSTGDAGGYSPVLPASKGGLRSPAVRC